MSTKEIIHKLIEATDRGDFESIRMYYHPEFIEHNPDSAAHVEAGIDGLEKAFELFDKVFPVRKHTIEDIIAEGDKVAARITFLAKGDGRIGKNDFTGKEYKITGTTFYRFENNQIIEKWTQVSVLKELNLVMTDLK